MPMDLQGCQYVHLRFFRLLQWQMEKQVQNPSIVINKPSPKKRKNGLIPF